MVKIGQKQGLYDELITSHAQKYMTKLWHNKRFSGYPIVGKVVPTDWEGLHNDHDSISKLLKSEKATPTDIIREEFEFIMRHCIWKRYCLQFSRDSCSDCQKNRSRISTEFMHLLEQLGGMIPVPSMSDVRTRTIVYESFIDLVNLILNKIKYASWLVGSQPLFLFPDECLPSLPAESPLLQACPEGCMYYGYPHADLKRHLRIVHHS